ncbi:Magnesium transport protein CorA, transmembrane region [Glarea lozoyensis ATCC 20868]|uniref:Magnesium transport protein CorA, transmembrane region n=1 Tax=Glarea lozoyensis (strain ATCC 20868 / MF5171) TaxID=1116229 RepID=S3D1A3_GLAL2|nr:Magnesium transport protein CorA, transmembrane region [Glarea lozoyensis ATCC 20868]EPE32292.1 Magnesium transport protein CorA, transmembrane region [Glarea lozoyensis ATCC 20868]
MADSTGEVKTVVGAELTGYIHKHKLAQFLKDLFGKEIKVFLKSDRFFFYAPRKMEKDELDSGVMSEISLDGGRNALHSTRAQKAHSTASPSQTVSVFNILSSNRNSATDQFFDSILYILTMSDEKSLSEGTKRGLDDEFAFNGWRQYPENVILEPAAVNIQSYKDRLSRCRSRIFSEDSLDLEVAITDLRGDDQRRAVSHDIYTDSQCVENHLEYEEVPNTRIISLHSQTSLDPVKITEECMLKICTHYSIGGEFLDLLLALGNKPKDSDAGLGRTSVTYRPDGSYGKNIDFMSLKGNLLTVATDICYMMVYIEETSGKRTASWPVRQTVVFHRFTPNSDGNLWILIHPMPNSILQQRLQTLILGESNFTNSSGCAKLHLLALSSYIENWRWYLKALSDEFEEIADQALTLEFSRPEDYKDGYKTLTQLQYLQERLFPLKARFETSHSVVCSLMELADKFYAEGHYDETLRQAFSNNLRNFASKYQGHSTSSDLLVSRVSGLIKLLSVTLNLKNQATSVDINHNMLTLTKDTVDDSATVRVVTLVTLIYLPASFISSLLGMNLFSYTGRNGDGFEISNQFWIFIALSVPLTILTVGSWSYISYKRRRNKALQNLALKEQHPGVEV